MVGGDDAAARGVFFLRVVFEGIEAEFVCLTFGGVKYEGRVHAFGADGQLGGRPPGDITLGVDPDYVQARGMDFAGGGTGFVPRVGAVELIKRVEERVLGFQKSPPQGNRRGAQGFGVGGVDERAVRRAAQDQFHGRLAFDGNGFGALGECDPLALMPDLLRVDGVDLFSHQVNVVVLEHGQAPAKLRVVPQQRHRVKRLVVAV